MIDPRLQGRGDVEVDEAGGEDHRVGGEQLVERDVGNADRFGLARGAGFGRRVDACGIVGIDVRQRVGDEIAHDKRVRRIGGKQLIDKLFP